MKWERYLGIVVVRNITDPVCLEVFCPELTPLADGEIKPVIGKMKSRQGSVKLGKTISCVFIGSTNRSIPDMHIGEQVMVKRHPSSDIYYWEPMGRDDKLRMTEHMKFYILNKPKMEGEVLDANCYYFEMDSRPEVKHIILKSSNTTGEPFIYTFEIDTKIGTVRLQDDIGNFWFLESALHKWTWQNTDLSMIQLDKTTINIFSVDIINITTKTLNVAATDINRTVANTVTDTIKNAHIQMIEGAQTITIGKGSTLTVGAACTITAGGDMAISAAGAIGISAGAILGLASAGAATVNGVGIP